MKRRDFFKATGVAVATLALRAFAQDEPADMTRARVELFEWTEEGLGTKVGWIMMKTTLAGKLIVKVHLEQGDPLTWFDVRVTVNDWSRFADVGTLITNDRGRGNARLVLPISEYPEDPIEPAILNVRVDLYWAVEGQV